MIYNYIIIIITYILTVALPENKKIAVCKLFTKNQSEKRKPNLKSDINLFRLTLNWVMEGNGNNTLLHLLHVFTPFAERLSHYSDVFFQYTSQDPG